MFCSSSEDEEFVGSLTCPVSSCFLLVWRTHRTERFVPRVRTKSLSDRSPVLCLLFLFRSGGPTGLRVQSFGGRKALIHHQTSSDDPISCQGNSYTIGSFIGPLLCMISCTDRSDRRMKSESGSGREACRVSVFLTACMKLLYPAVEDLNRAGGLFQGASTKPHQ